jgi:phospholipid transport system substrate-binding protein
MKKKLQLVLVLPFVFAGAALAQTSVSGTDGIEVAVPDAKAAINVADPVILMTGVTDHLLAALKQDHAKLAQDPNYIYQIVNNILLPHIDTEGMSRSVLGRTAWAKATADERQAFTKVFLQTVIQTYSAALNAYTDQTVKYYPLRGGIAGRTLIQIDSQILREQGPAVSINYRLVKIGNEWKVYDMSVEGVGLLESFRAQVKAELSSGLTLTQLTQKLKSHNANNQSPS